MDTGDKFGIVYKEPTYTAFFDHHAKGTKEVTSTAKIVYKTMVDLGMIEKSEAIDRLFEKYGLKDSAQKQQKTVFVKKAPHKENPSLLEGFACDLSITIIRPFYMPNI